MRTELSWSVLAAVAGLSCALGPSEARADQAADRAAALTNEGAAAYSKGDYGTCRAKAAEAWSIFQHVEIAGLLGACEVKLGQYADGAAHLDFYITNNTGQVDPDAPKLLEEAKKNVAEVTLACHPEGVVFKIDGKAIAAQGGQTVYLTPGAHTIEAEKPGFEPKQEPESLTAATKVVVNIQLSPVTRPIIPGIVVLSVGVVGLAIGGGLLGAHAAKISDGEHIAMTTCQAMTCQALKDDASAANAFGNAGEGLMIGGGIAAAAGAGLLIWALTAPHAAGNERSAFIVLPAVGKGMQGAVIEGSF